MTNKQAIELLKWFGEYNDIDYHGGDMIENDKGDRFYRVVKEDLEAFDMAIKALSQQTEDAISRQAAIEKIHWLGLDNDTAIKCDLALRALPSVKPQESKTGRWIIDKGSLDAFYGEVCKCSECGGESIGTSYFCPYCGAKMEG